MPCIGLNRKDTDRPSLADKRTNNNDGSGRNANKESKEKLTREAYISARNRGTGDDCRGRTTVELHKTTGDLDLGLVVTGGVDKNSSPRAAYLKPGGIAYLNDDIEVGDSIVTINGRSTALLKHSDVIHLLQADRVLLELEYILPEPQQMSFSVLCKSIGIVLDRDSNGTFGMTLRGGANPDPAKCRPLTVTQIRPGGPADREGTLKVGDRILSINGLNMAERTLSQALKFLKDSQYRQIDIHLEYDVSVLEAVQNATGPLLVEIDKLPGLSLGICVGQALYRGKRVLYIDGVVPASIADRCGALHVGDHVLSIDGVRLDSNTSTTDATRLLNSNAGNQVQLEIVPVILVKSQTDTTAFSRSPRLGEGGSGVGAGEQSGGGRGSPTELSRCNSNSTVSKSHSRLYTSQSLNSLSSQQSRATWHSMTTQVGSAVTSYGTLRSRAGGQRDDTLTKKHGGVMLSSNQAQVCHVDTTEVMLIGGPGGFGLTIDAPSSGGIKYKHSDILMEPPIISSLKPKGPAERCGVLQEGDRVLSINGLYLDGRTMEEVEEFIRDSGVKMLLLVEFDVAESIVPSSGVFTVKLAKRGSGLGITISCPKNRRRDQHLVITDVKKGSVAHRTGTIQPGDQLLAIDNVRLDDCTLEDSARVLQDAQDIVKLTVKKDENFADEPDPTHLITYTVELPKFAGPLGIVISGCEEPFEPVIISSLTEAGLAAKTGALLVGDRLLAINGVSLRGKTLTDAVQLLQNAGQTVTLKITRPTNKKGAQGKAAGGKYHDSMDSALESWDSSGIDGTRARSRAGLRNQHTFDGSSNGSNPSNNADNASVAHSSHSNGGGATATTVAAIAQANCRKWAEGGGGGGGGGGDFMSAASPSSGGSIPRSCSSSTAGGDGGGLGEGGGGKLSGTAIDEWSERLDELDQLTVSKGEGLDDDNILDSFSDLPDISEITSRRDTGLKRTEGDGGTNVPRCTPHPRGDQRLGVGGDEDVSPHVGGGGDDWCPSEAGDCFSDVTTADVHLKEVEEQLQNIFTPTPIELMKVTLSKQKDADDFGFSLCDGVFEKGVYVGAIKPRGPAADILKPFDRILQVNSSSTKDLDCCQVVPLIANTGGQVDLVISRNPLVWGLDPLSKKTFNDRLAELRSRDSAGGVIGEGGGEGGGGEDEMAKHRRRDTLPRQSYKTKEHQKSVTSLNDGNRAGR